jgi:Tfp pilus assembly protein PilF
MPCSSVTKISPQLTLQAAETRGYIWNQPVRKLSSTICLALFAVGVAGPAYADARSEARAQVEFGINVAQRGLWREAIYRWERAVEIDPTYAAAFNDLAVAYEHEGQLDKARQAYEKALALEPENAQIRQNFELFKEINDRTSAAKEKP